MDANDLNEFYKNNFESRSFFNWLKDSKEKFRILGVSYAEEKSGVDYYEIVSIFKELDKLGAGEFIVGRKGHDSRFIWNYDTHALSDAAVKGKYSIFGILEVSEDAIEAITPPKQKIKIETIKHSFNLRRDFVVDIELPSDFDGGDLSRLKNWLDLLVY